MGEWRRCVRWFPRENQKLNQNDTWKYMRSSSSTWSTKINLDFLVFFEFFFKGFWFHSFNSASSLSTYSESFCSLQYHPLPHRFLSKATKRKTLRNDSLKQERKKKRKGFGCCCCYSALIKFNVTPPPTQNISKCDLY